MAADAVARIERRHGERLDLVEQAFADRPRDLRAQIVEAVPDQAAALADDPPRAFPAGAKAVGAPAAAVGEHLAVAELEDGGRRRSLPVPGVGRLPFLAIDAERLAVHHVAGRVERVDRHVEEQHMAHLLAEAAEMRRDEEVGMDAGRRADRAGIEEAPDAPDIGDVAAVLDDGMDATGRGGRPR